MTQDGLYQWELISPLSEVVHHMGKTPSLGFRVTSSSSSPQRRKTLSAWTCLDSPPKVLTKFPAWKDIISAHLIHLSQ